MCLLGGSSPTAPSAPIRYAQQRTPTRGDTGDAQSRAEARRRRATSTILTRSEVGDVDETGKKTLLGA